MPNYACLTISIFIKFSEGLMAIVIYLALYFRIPILVYSIRLFIGYCLQFSLSREQSRLKYLLSCNIRAISLNLSNYVYREQIRYLANPLKITYCVLNVSHEEIAIYSLFRISIVFFSFKLMKKYMCD